MTTGSSRNVKAHFARPTHVPNALLRVCTIRPARFIATLNSRHASAKKSTSSCSNITAMSTQQSSGNRDVPHPKSAILFQADDPHQFCPSSSIKSGPQPLTDSNICHPLLLLAP
eukprot:CAMPEP_0119124690 /NCGR_PEP_ID=MMETSP1310-20130426/4237_1 /TAXON_ID=464262 /ORGANISM="Genus nov. species nov., Strain RCC2339" /LENGTH=113 /DNA_ID=CAMNT_0007114681 /DNA_START=875 /DNA_END=1212 /DNA_ORIENTATION=+